MEAARSTARTPTTVPPASSAHAPAVAHTPPADPNVSGIRAARSSPTRVLPDGRSSPPARRHARSSIGGTGAKTPRARRAASRMLIASTGRQLGHHATCRPTSARIRNPAASWAASAMNRWRTAHSSPVASS